MFTKLLVLAALALASATSRTIDEIIRDAAARGKSTLKANEIMVDMDMRYRVEDYEEMKIDTHKGIRGEHFRWTNKVMPYTISNTFSDSQKSIILRGMREWEKYTCLTMKPRGFEKNFVHIQDDGSGCNSYVGMRNWGRQPMNLAKWGCLYHATVVHEIGHAIGFEHEHQRPIRDSYVTIIWNNVGKGWEYAFNKHLASNIDNRNITYDYKSVMHYGKTAFSHNNRDITIKTKDPSYQDVIGRSPGLVFSDIKLANLLYKCDDGCASKTCSNGGFVGKDCKCWCDSGDWSNPVCECGTSGCDGSGGGDDPNCVDNNSNCAAWAARGECDSNPDYMLYNCAKSCKICGDGAVCKDYKTDCNYWAGIGHCTNDYEEYMKRFCRKACKIC